MLLVSITAFHQWFLKYKAEEFHHSTLRSLREEIGLPPKAFYTNDNEGIGKAATARSGKDHHRIWSVQNKVPIYSVAFYQLQRTNGFACLKNNGCNT